MSKKTCIYLANSYSSKLKDPDAAKYQEIQRRLLESYIGGQLKKKYNVSVILPIAMSASMADICAFDTGFSTWADDDLNFISRCDEVWVLVSDGWDTSVGVAAEIAFAKENNIPVKYIHKDTITVHSDLGQVPGDRLLDEWGL